MILVITTPFTHFIIYFDAAHLYHHGSLYLLFVGYNLIILLISLIIVTLYGSEMPKGQRTTVITYVLLIISANIVQIFHPLLSINGLILSIATFLMFFTLQNPAAYYDSLTNNYSRATLQEYVDILVSKNSHFQFIIVDVKGTTGINKALGEEIGTDIITRVGKKVLIASGSNLSFKMDGDLFIIITLSIKERDITIKALKNRFPFKYHFSDYTFDVNIHLNYTDTLFDFENPNEANEIIKECTLVSKKREISLINNSFLDEIKKNRKIEKALQNSIDNQNILVYLQPIYSSETKKCVKAEALIRLYDRDLGIIMPDEFIHLAESNGSITKLAPLIIQKVCNFLNSTKLPDTFKNISINLSVIDCLNPNLDQLILGMLKKNNIKSNQITFEITETIASLVPELEKNMYMLKKSGIQFALDDFGSGYANIDTVVKLPFNIIKIDRQLLLLINDPKYSIILKSFIDIFLALKLELVVEGIENEWQAEEIRKMGATYQQGFLYSPPISMEDFTKLVISNN
ncbi:MAG: GGDEF domain-containing protein [Spirochaetaceae bacterium]|nr:GGDEF domain-containing protein [Spirochaetaceae bacterium]